VYRIIYWLICPPSPPIDSSDRTNQPLLFRDWINNCTNLFRPEPNHTCRSALATVDYSRRWPLWRSALRGKSHSGTAIIKAMTVIWCHRNTCHHTHVTRASILCHKSQRPHKTRPCFMCTLPTLTFFPVYPVATAIRRGRPWRRCSSGTSKDTASDRCVLELKLSRPSIWGISGGKWPSLRWLSPNCIVCPPAGTVLTAQCCMFATVGVH